MDERIARLETPEGAEQFAINVEAMGLPDLVLAARRRAVELRAAAHGAKTAAEREALEAVYAYERVRTTASRKFRASRTWQMIERRGIIAAVEQDVSRPDESMGHEALVKAGMGDKSFEEVVLRHRDVFSAKTVDRAEARRARGDGTGTTD